MDRLKRALGEKGVETESLTADNARLKSMLRMAEMAGEVGDSASVYLLEKQSLAADNLHFRGLIIAHMSIYGNNH